MRNDGKGTKFFYDDLSEGGFNMKRRVLIGATMAAGVAAGLPFTQNRQIFHPHSPGHLVALPPVGFLRQGSPALNGTFDSNSAVCFGSSLSSE